MSRGLGALQRRVCAVLYAAGDEGLPLRELRRRLGEPDRSNLRRAIRGLLQREIVEGSGPGGERRLALTVWGYIGLSTRLASPEGRRTSGTGSSETERAAEDGSKTGRRRLHTQTAGGPG